MTKPKKVTTLEQATKEMAKSKAGYDAYRAARKAGERDVMEQHRTAYTAWNRAYTKSLALRKQEAEPDPADDLPPSG